MTTSKTTRTPPMQDPAKLRQGDSPHQRQQVPVMDNDLSQEELEEREEVKRKKNREAQHPAGGSA